MATVQYSTDSRKDEQLHYHSEKPIDDPDSFNENLMPKSQEVRHNDYPEHCGNDKSSPFDNTSNDSDILGKVAKEAEKIKDHITNDEINIFNKYDHLSEQELQGIIKKKNKIILEMSREQEQNKAELGHLIRLLNDSLEKSGGKLYKREKNPVVMKQLENLIQIKMKDLSNYRSQSKIFKQQFELLNTKVNEKFTNERLNEIEEKIDYTRKENLELVRQIRAFRNTQVIQSKEIETCNRNKKYPGQISNYTEEIKSLANKKHEYFTKIVKNKKSLSNTKNYLTQIVKFFRETISKPGIDINEGTVKYIEREISQLEEDLNGKEDEIMERCEKGLVNNYRPYENENNPFNIVEKKIIKKKYLPPLTSNRQLSLNKDSGYAMNNHLKSKEKIYHSHSIQSPGRGYTGIFNKYNYLTSKDQLKAPHYMKQGADYIKENTAEIEDNEECDNLDFLKIDYEHTSNHDFLQLKKKKDALILVNSKLERNIKEVERLYEKKIKDITNTIEHNSKKVKVLQHQNDLLAAEISDLSKIIRLNMEESKLRKEIKESEIKIYKNLASNVPTVHNNIDVSETRNDILQDLNILNEGEKGTKTKPKSSKRENKVIEEEHHEGGDTGINSMMRGSEGQLEAIENKNIKFPDLSNVEQIEEDGGIVEQREKKINEIREKYISLENEKENLNLNSSDRPDGD